MPRSYRNHREHLDDIIALARCVVGRSNHDGQALAELDVEIVERGEQIEASLELARARGEDLPLDRLRTAFQLEPAEMRCLYLLLALAVSAEVRALAGRHDGTGTLELLDELVYAAPAIRDAFADHLAADGRLFAYGLIEYAGDDGNRLSRPVRIADRLVELAYGRDVADFGGYAVLVEPEDEHLIVSDHARTTMLAALQRHVERSGGAVPLVRGAEGAGRRALVAGAARVLGAKLLLVRCGALPFDGLRRVLVEIRREAVLARAVIVLCDAEQLVADPELGRRDRTGAIERAFAAFPGPIAMTARANAQPRVFGANRGVIAIDLPALAESDRATLWTRWLPDAAPEVIADAAARYRLSGGAIRQAARVVREAAEPVATTAIHAGVRAVLDDKLTSLGMRIDWRQRWEDLVLPDDCLEELREMIGRVRHRKRVLDEWGFGDRLAKGLGVAALFSGPPGTGKTMAAGLVAVELGLDLYQIDLSRMVSKFIGETEKHLAQVFDAAETGHAVLLFDEADSLFSKRTDVKTSTDRYANLEVNYLLQRMEAFTGITILTTNFDTAIDDAFRRRLAFRIAFPLPEAEERMRLWQSIIPVAARTNDIDFKSLARNYEMSGGYIRNAALRAAFLAAGDNTRITMQHLIKAASAEYAAMGKVMSSGVGSGLR